MATDDFLLITPEGWTEIPNATHLVAINGGEAAVNADLIAQNWAVVNEYQELKETEWLPEFWTVTAARLYNTGEPTNNLRLWIKTAPL